MINFGALCNLFGKHCYANVSRRTQVICSSKVFGLSGLNRLSILCNRNSNSYVGVSHEYSTIITPSSSSFINATATTDPNAEQFNSNFNLNIEQTQNSTDIHPLWNSLNQIQTVSEEFYRLIKERGLDINPSQIELVAKLQRLQNIIVECDKKGVFLKRLQQGCEELKDSPAYNEKNNFFLNDSKIKHIFSKQSLTVQNISKFFLSSFLIKNSNQPENVSNKTLVLSATPFLNYPTLRSLYVWGGVGQGKTMLMDALFHSTQIQKKSRYHFHNFILNVQERLHKLHINDTIPISSPVQQENVTPLLQNNVVPDHWDPILYTAYLIASECHFLCLDEFQVVHIADAMILKRLFEALLHFGCIIVTTSNREPDDLYKGGLNRDRFLPCIHLLKDRWDIFHISTERDFRQNKRRPSTIKTHKNDSIPKSSFYNFNCPPRSKDVALQHFISISKTPPVQSEIQLMMGRTLQIPYAANNVCLFDFKELCQHPVGTPDFIGLANEFHTVFLMNIDLLDQFDENPNEIKRFIQLIDVLYERHVQVIFDSNIPLLRLFGETLTTQAFDTLRQHIINDFPRSISDFYSTLNEFMQQHPSCTYQDALATVGHIPLDCAAHILNVLETYTRCENNTTTNIKTSHYMKDSINAFPFIQTLKAAFMYYTYNFDLIPCSYLTNGENELTQQLEFDFGINLNNSMTDSTGSSDNRFASTRCLSRIKHMLSEDYIAEHPHIWEMNRSSHN